MNWFKKAQQVFDLNIWNDCYDYHSGENFCRVIAEDKTTGKVIGYIDYSYYDGEVDIKMIQVDAPYRRQGVGTKMIEFLKREVPEAIIRTGLATEDGYPFVQSLKKKKIL